MIIKKEDNSTEENNTALLNRKPRLDLDKVFNEQIPNENGEYIVELTDGSGNFVLDENGEKITATYIGSNIFECREERGSSSYLAKKYLRKSSVNGNEYWTYNGQKLTSLRKN